MYTNITQSRFFCILYGWDDQIRQQAMKDRIVLEVLLMLSARLAYGLTQLIRLTEVMSSNMLTQIKRDRRSIKAFRTACSGSSTKEAPAIVRRLVGLPIADKSLEVGYVHIRLVSVIGGVF